MHKMMEKVLDFLCDLAPEVIKFPDDMERLAEDFQEVTKPFPLPTANENLYFVRFVPGCLQLPGHEIRCD